ncbi:MAG: thioredoxin fold domain-containing protein [Bacteroidota bacterium]|nr:thioredoxin fold domain-containing protein [Bacteroidota bacterium]
MFKKICVFVLAVMLWCSVFAQQNGKTGIAPFSIRMLNGKTYTYKELKKNTPTVLIYFSPTCEHCQAFTKELLKYDKELKDKQIVMVTYQPVKEMKPFDSMFHISSKHYIKMGTEGYTFLVQKYYGVQRFPFVVMFNKEMKWVKTIPFVTEPEEVAKEVVSL